MEENLLYIQSYIFEGPRYHIKGINWHDIRKMLTCVLSVNISLFSYNLLMIGICMHVQIRTGSEEDVNSSGKSKYWIFIFLSLYLNFRLAS